MNDNGIDQTNPNNVSVWTRDFVIIALINLTAIASCNMLVTGIPVYIVQLGGSDIMAGLAITITTICALLIRPFSGIAMNRFGRKNILILCLLVLTLNTFANALFPVISIILVLRMIHGASWGISTTVVSTIAADNIPRKRFAEGMGYFAMSTSLALAVSPALALALLQNIGINTMVIVATIICAASLLFATMQKPQQRVVDEIKNKLTWTDLFEKHAFLPSVMMFLFSCSLASITTFIALHALSREVNTIFIYFIVYSVTNVVSRPFIGRIIDRKGFFFPVLFSAVGVGITLLIISFSTNIFMFCIAGIFGGLGLGTGTGALQTMAVASVPPQRRGVAMSTFFIGFDGGLAVGSAIAGILSNALGYSNMYMIFIVFPAIAFFVFLSRGKRRIDEYSN